MIPSDFAEEEAWLLLLMAVPQLGRPFKLFAAYCPQNFNRTSQKSVPHRWNLDLDLGWRRSLRFRILSPVLIFSSSFVFPKDGSLVANLGRVWFSDIYARVEQISLGTSHSAFDVVEFRGEIWIYLTWEYSGKIVTYLYLLCFLSVVGATY